MNNLVSNYQQILLFAQQNQIPLQFERAILREYLQSMALDALYSQPESQKLAFIGGTALRLLRNIDRFSEDLDFDNLGLTDDTFAQMVQKVIERYRRENIEVELFSTVTNGKKYYELRFPNLLYDLKITTNDKEKLKIKIDYSQDWRGHKPEVVLFSKYGFIEQVKTNPLNQLLVQKLAAFIGRKQTQPRDMYDAVWLYAAGARLDKNFCHQNNLDQVVEDAIAKFRTEGLSQTLERRLQPFLFKPESIKKLRSFESVLLALSDAS